MRRRRLTLIILALCVLAAILLTTVQPWTGRAPVSAPPSPTHPYSSAPHAATVPLPHGETVMTPKMRKLWDSLPKPPTPKPHALPLMVHDKMVMAMDGTGPAPKVNPRRLGVHGHILGLNNSLPTPTLVTGYQNWNNTGTLPNGVTTQDDRAALIAWDGGSATTTPEDAIQLSQSAPPNGIYGYYITWGPAASPSANHVLSSFHAVELQPLTNGASYVAVVQAVDQTGALGPASAQISFTGDNSRVENLRQQFTGSTQTGVNGPNGFFDDFNQTQGGLDHTKWSEGFSYCDVAGETTQFINAQYHAHQFNGYDNCDRGQVVMHPNTPFDISGGRTGTVAFDMDTTDRRSEWYLDFLPTKYGSIDVDGHTSTESRNAAAPGCPAYPGSGAQVSFLRILLQGGYSRGQQILRAYWVQPNGYESQLGAANIPNAITWQPNLRRHWVIRMAQNHLTISNDGVTLIDTPVGTAQNTLDQNGSPGSANYCPATTFPGGSLTSAGFPDTSFYLMNALFTYNTRKENLPGHLMHFDNFGFDGPGATVVTHDYWDTGYSARQDSTTVIAPNSWNDPISIPDSVAGASGALLNFTYTGSDCVGNDGINHNDSTEHVDINGHAIAIPVPTGGGGNGWFGFNTPYAYSLPFDPTWLTTGTNNVVFYLNKQCLHTTHIRVQFPNGSAPSYTDPSRAAGIDVVKPTTWMGDTGPDGLVGINGQWASSTSSVSEHSGVPVYTISGASVPLKWQFESNSSLIVTGKEVGVDHVEIWVDATQVYSASTSTDVPAPTTWGTYNLDTTVIPNGAHNIYIRAYDKAGTLFTPNFFLGETVLPQDWSIPVNVQNSGSQVAQWTATPTPTPVPVAVGNEIDDSNIGTGDLQWTYNGTWNSCTNCGVGQFFNSSMHWTDTTGNTAVFHCSSCAGFAWYSDKNTSHGIANVQIDGGTPTQVDTYGNTGTNYAAYYSPALTLGAHTLTISASGSKYVASTGISIDSDAAIAEPNGYTGAAGPTSTPAPPSNPTATPTLAAGAPTNTPAPTSTPGGPATVDDAVIGTGVNQWQYTAGWQTFTGVSVAYAGTLHGNVKTTSDVATLTFNGTGVNLTLTTAPTHGYAAIKIDGGSPTVVDTYGATFGTAQVFSVTGLTAGQHTLTVAPTGTHDASASDAYIDLDVAQVTSGGASATATATPAASTPTPAPTLPPGSASQISVNVNPSVVSGTVPTRGVNMIAWNDWEPLMDSQSAAALKNMGVSQVRFPGGSPADYYSCAAPNRYPAGAKSLSQVWNWAQSWGATSMVFGTNANPGDGGTIPGTTYTYNSPQASAVCATMAYTSGIPLSGTVFEVGNEEDLNNEPIATYDTSFSGYADALHNAQAGTQIISQTGALVAGPVSPNEYQFWATDEAGAFLRAHGNKTGDGKADALSVHFYKGTNWNDTKYLAQYWQTGPGAYLKQTVAANDTRKLPVYISEWNLGGSDTGTPYAATLGHALADADLLGAFGATGVSGEDYFYLHGCTKQGLLCDTSGEVVGGATQPADAPNATYYAMALWGQMGRTLVASNAIYVADSSAVDPGSVVSTWATTDASGKTEVMLINKQATVQTVHVNVAGQALAGQTIQVASLSGVDSTQGYSNTSVLYNGAVNPSVTGPSLPAAASQVVPNSGLDLTLPAYSMEVVMIPNTPVSTPTPTNTPTATSTPAATVTPGGPPTTTPTNTATPSATATAQPTQTPTNTPTPRPTSTNPGAVQLTLTATGIAPASGYRFVRPGGQVTIVNQDSVAHTLTLTRGLPYFPGSSPWGNGSATVSIAAGASVTLTVPTTPLSYPYAFVTDRAAVRGYIYVL